MRRTSLLTLTLGLLSGSAAGVVAHETPTDESVPVSFKWATTHSVECATPDVPYTYDLDESGRDSTRGLAWCLDLEADDPRVSGLYIRVDNSETFGLLRGGGLMGGVTRFSMRGTNDDGAWSGSGFHASAAADDAPVGVVWQAILAGEGDYEGLTLLLAGPSSVGDSWGMIVPDDVLPPVPEPLGE